MPNWCSNVLKITHEDKQKLREVAEAYKAGKLFEYFVPFPNGEWDYDWCVQNWGTKWDINAEGGDDLDVEEFVANGGGDLSFDTAWGPGLNALEEAENQGFDLTCYYHEPGMTFAGVFTAGDDECYEYGSMSIDEIRETLPEDLEEIFSIADDVEYYRLEETESAAESYPSEEKDAKDQSV